MNSPAADTATYLVAQGVGVLGAASGWSVNVSKEPVAPDTTVTVRDTSGLAPDPDNDFYQPGIQIRIRGNGYQAAWAKLEEVRTILEDAIKVTIGGTSYIGFYQQGSAEHIGYDESDRAILTANFIIDRQET